MSFNDRLNKILETFLEPLVPGSRAHAIMTVLLTVEPSDPEFAAALRETQEISGREAVKIWNAITRDTPYNDANAKRIDAVHRALCGKMRDYFNAELGVPEPEAPEN